MSLTGTYYLLPLDALMELHHFDMKLFITLQFLYLSKNIRLPIYGISCEVRVLFLYSNVISCNYHHVVFTRRMTSHIKVPFYDRYLQVKTFLKQQIFSFETLAKTIPESLEARYARNRSIT